MTEPKGQSDPNETPEDVASLYSWANLHGAKYRDFSAARAQTREKARLRTEQAMEEALRQHQPAAPAPQPAAEIRATEQAQAAAEFQAAEPPVAEPEVAEQFRPAEQVQTADPVQTGDP